MKLGLLPIASPFLAVNAASLSVESALQLLQARRVSWIAIRDGESCYVLSRKELAAMREMSPRATLQEVPRLGAIEPDIVLPSARATLDLPERPATRRRKARAVVLAKRPGGELYIQAIGHLVKAAAKRPAQRTKPRLSRSSWKLSSATKRGRAIGLHPIGYAPSASGKKGQPSKPHSWRVVDVLYATDREFLPPTSEAQRARYKNCLPAKPQLEYGVCHVTIPPAHEPGHIESPSFWHFELRAKPGKHFTICGCEPRTSQDFFADLNLRVRDSAERACFVFIHGFNVSFDDAAKCTAQLAADLKFLGAPVLYSWASANSPRRYSKDAETVALTQRPFEQFLSDVARTSGATRIHLIAHSMGNRALIEALGRLPAAEDAKTFDQVVLAAPDVPMQNADSHIALAGAKANRLTLYASRRDSALWLSSWKNAYQRLGRIDRIPVVLPGMDTIDVSKFKGDFWNHSAFLRARDVVNDLKDVLSGQPPARRFAIKPAATPEGGVYWVLS